MSLPPKPDDVEQARIIRAQIRILQSKIATAEGDRMRAVARLEALSKKLDEERAALAALTGDA